MPTQYVVEATATNFAAPIPAWVQPLRHGGALYGVFQDFNQSAFTQTVGVFKSLDGGHTWTAQDAGNEPAFDRTFEACAGWLSGDTIYIVYVTGGNIAGAITGITFDLNTDTFGPPIPGGKTVGILITGTPYQNVVVQPLSTAGHFVTVFTANTPTNHTGLYAQLYNGSWQTPVLIDAGTTATLRLRSVAMDSSDRLHILWFKDETITLNSCIFSGGAAGATTVIMTGSPTVQHIGNGLYFPSTDTIRFPAKGVPPITSGSQLWVSLVGTPSSAPVWSWEQVSDVTGDGTADFLGEPILARASDTNFFMYWADAVSGFGRIMYSRNTGSGWGPATVLWDSAVDPLTPPSANPAEILLLQGGSADESGGTTTLRIFSGLFATTPGGDFCAVEYYTDLQIAGPPPVSGRKFLPQYIKRPNNANA